MLDKILENPDLEKFLITCEADQTIFLEGDETQDLYILVSGQLEVLKGNKKISEITEKGHIFGEMSFLLGDKRTATVKAKNNVKAICIPRKNVTAFLHEFPSVAQEITTLLARRLDETSQILCGLKDFCDQLPDAVILTNREGKILAWNSSAERLYGRGWNQMRDKPVDQIYDEPGVYKNFIEEVKAKHYVREKILTIRHPEKGIRFISNSTTLLYDCNHNFQGVISLERDVTTFKKMEMKLKRVRHWLIPSFIILALFFAVLFFGYPYFSKGYQNVDIRKQEMKNQLAKDYLLLKSLLADHFAADNRAKASQLLKDFFDIQDITVMPYTGLVLLNKEKKVIDAYSVKKNTVAIKMIGSSYAGIEFKGNERSLHKVLTLYRADKDHPMGNKEVEIAFEMIKDNQFLGWLVFQVDMDLLKKKYDIDEEALKKFHFRKP